MANTDEKAELVQGAELVQHPTKPPDGVATSEGTGKTEISGISPEVTTPIAQPQAQPSPIQKPTPQQQQQHEQAPQTMALVNGQLVPVTIVAAQGSTALQSPVPVVLPQVQVNVQSQPGVVDVQAHIIQNSPALNNTSTPEKTDDNKPAETAGVSSVQSTSQQAADLKKPQPQPQQTQTQPNGKVNTGTNAKEDEGCGLCAAIKQLFGMGKDVQSGDEPEKKNDHTGSNNQSLGGTVVKLAMQSVAQSTNAASQNKRSQLPSQVTNNAGTSSNANNATAPQSTYNQYPGQGGGETYPTAMTDPVVPQPNTSDATVPPNVVYIVSGPGQIQQQDMNPVEQQTTMTDYAQPMSGYESGQINNQIGEDVFPDSKTGEEGQGDFEDDEFDEDYEVDADF